MSRRYHFYGMGCQMNNADIRHVASGLEELGYQAADRIEEADVVILQTCTVRQSVEDKAYNRLASLRLLKERRPDIVIAVMGCLVGIKGNQSIRERFPFVDVLMPPSNGRPLLDYLLQHDVCRGERLSTNAQHPWMLPSHQRGQLVSAPVAVVYGCSHGCSYCQIPVKRGPERSRPAEEVNSTIHCFTSKSLARKKPLINDQFDVGRFFAEQFLGAPKV